jgi:threonine dehydrogenase-like Zn-dependent dehydrogenase
MRAVLFQDKQLSYQAEQEAPKAGPKDALVKVSKAGVCNTDLELVKGYMGFNGVLGHEFVGVVEACESQPQWVGQRVCVDINAACGVCDTCVVEKQPHHCPHRTVLGIVNHGGAFADYIVAPYYNLYPVPANVSDEEAVFVEPLAAAFEIPEQMKLAENPKAKGYRVIVQGDGKLGLLIAQVMRLYCDEVLLFGKHSSKMALVEPFGVTPVLITKTPVESFFKTADIVVEVSGTAAGLSQAMNLCKPRGTVVLKSTVAEGAALDLSPLVIDELTLLGSRCGPFDVALQALAAKTVNPLPLIQHRFPLEAGVEAMAVAASRGTLKVLLEL